MYNTKNSKHGFTLVELIACIVILSVLTALAIPSAKNAFTTSDFKSNCALAAKIEKVRKESMEMYSSSRGNAFIGIDGSNPDIQSFLTQHDLIQTKKGFDLKLLCSEDKSGLYGRGGAVFYYLDLRDSTDPAYEDYRGKIFFSYTNTSKSANDDILFYDKDGTSYKYYQLKGGKLILLSQSTADFSTFSGRND